MLPLDEERKLLQLELVLQEGRVEGGTKCEACGRWNYHLVTCPNRRGGPR